MLDEAVNDSQTLIIVSVRVRFPSQLPLLFPQHFLLFKGIMMSVKVDGIIVASVIQVELATVRDKYQNFFLSLRTFFFIYLHPFHCDIYTNFFRNDNGPVFESELYKNALSRDAIAGTKIVTVIARDPDLINTNIQSSYHFSFSLQKLFNKIAISML